MSLTRRSLFGWLPGLAATAVAATTAPLTIPSADSASGDDLRPLLLEHTCDWGRNRYTAEQVAESEADYLQATGAPRYWGCGTTFRWYFGVQPYCPKCGYCYETTIEVLRAGAYRIVEGRLPE